MNQKREKREKKGKLFSYAWHLDEKDEEVSVIRIYGLNEKNENICLRVNNFTPYCYLELPLRTEKDVYIKWTESRALLVANKISRMMPGDKGPIDIQLMWRHRLYYAHLNKDGTRKVFPYLFCKFNHHADIRLLSYKITKALITPLGKIKLRIHEHNATPILQFTSVRDLPTAGWIGFLGKKIPKNYQITRCDHEYVVNWRNTWKCKEKMPPAKPLVMGWDIEVNSSNPARMPSADEPADKVFQISCILSRQGDPPEKYKKYLLTLGKPDQKTTGKDTTILSFDIEAELLEGFTAFVNKHNPNVLVGYNIFGFDIPYMIDRATLLRCSRQFEKIGFLKNVPAEQREISWSSSAYGDQDFRYLDAEGRLFVDLLPLVKRDYKFSNYRLKTISAHFLKGLTKEDLDAQGIFKCYRIGMKGGKKGAKALGVCGRYCVKDSILMNMLFEKLQTWIGLSEMATVVNIPIFHLYTRGQQVRVFSQVYKKCTHENICVEKDGYIPREDERYIGATVFPPVPGVYDRVIPLDFSSLYPSTMIAYNLDFSTLVRDDDKTIPESNILELKWDEHMKCDHDPDMIRLNELNKYINKEEKELKQLREKKKGKKGVRLKSLTEMIAIKKENLKPSLQERRDIKGRLSNNYSCCTRRFRWIKKPLGVLPSLLEHLLNARKAVKTQMKQLKKKLKEGKMTEQEKISLETEIVVLDKRQLAYKVSCNSAYGATGVRRGYLPMMPVAMSTTYMGRTNIGKVAKVIPEKYRGKVVYGD